MSEMAERVAAAILIEAEALELDVELWRLAELARKAARPAIQAMREPTSNMVDAGWHAERELHATSPEPGPAYRAMIDAALKD